MKLRSLGTFQQYLKRVITNVDDRDNTGLNHGALYPQHASYGVSGFGEDVYHFNEPNSTWSDLPMVVVDFGWCVKHAHLVFL
jgi:hypothetical protein